jgi:uncharacterized protein
MVHTLPIMGDAMPYALVTGASSGIGLHVAEELARRGFDLVLVARSPEQLAERKAVLERTYAIRVAVLACDLAAPDAGAQLYRAVRGAHAVPDILVNNAGFGAFGSFHVADGANLQRLIHLNVLTLTSLMHQVLPDMRARGSGRILNVASCAAFAPGPLMAVYFATKAYVLHLSEAVAEECAGSGVTVTALCPGSTTTDFHRTAGFPEDSWLFAPPVAARAESVARYGVRALLAGRRIAIPGFSNRLVVFALRVVPRRLAVILAHRALRH